MPIEFLENKAVREVISLSGLDKMETKLTYKISISNLKIPLEIKYSSLGGDIYSNIVGLNNFFQRNQISMFSTYMDERKWPEYLIQISFREDVLEDCSLCACILKTIVFALENIVPLTRRVNFNRRFSNIPALA